MGLEQVLMERSTNKCELCGATDELSAYEVPPSDGSADQAVLLCGTCKVQIDNPETMDANHWRCLNDAMWSPIPAVQVMAYRVLDALKTQVWAQDLLAMMYMEDDLKAWADAGVMQREEEGDVSHRDSNGNALREGDSVTLIKDLDVKGAGFTAKRGTLVKGIHLTDNPKHIEGKVNGVQIVLVTEYLKKA